MIISGRGRPVIVPRRCQRARDGGRLLLAVTIVGWQLDDLPSSRIFSIGLLLALRRGSVLLAALTVLPSLLALSHNGPARSLATRTGWPFTRAEPIRSPACPTSVAHRGSPAAQPSLEPRPSWR